MKNIIKRYLVLNKYLNHVNTFEDYFLSHPNYPSLYAITDSLTLLGIENVAARVHKEQFFDLPTSFLAFYNEELVLVEKNDNEVYITKEDNKRDLVSFDIFISDWDGIILAIEENIEKRTFKVNSEYFNQGLLLVSLFIAYFLNNKTSLNSISVIGFCFSFIGFIIGLFIIEEKYGANKNQLVSKICSFTDNTSCSSVIKSSNTLVSKWFDFSDLPIVFFGTALISQILNQQSISIVSTISIVSLPVVAYSIWLQRVKIKKWCVLCLAVSCILVLLSGVQFISLNDYSIKIISNFFAITGIILITWVLIKHYIIINANLVKENLELIKFKRTPAIFTSLLKPVTNHELIRGFNKILIGEKEASINLTLILSPSCSHCHTAYKEGVELYQQFKNKVSITILFNINPNNQLNKYLDVVFTMLKINKNEPQKIMDSLNDWHISRMTMENWSIKWNNATNNFENEKIDLLQHYNWCQKNNFNFTPIRLLNNDVFPLEYSVNDIKYFISVLEEKLETV